MKIEYEVCDRCYKEIAPKNWIYRIDKIRVKSFCGKQGVSRTEWVLCKSCVRALKKWINMEGEEDGTVCMAGSERRPESVQGKGAATARDSAL